MKKLLLLMTVVLMTFTASAQKTNAKNTTANSPKKDSANKTPADSTNNTSIEFDFKNWDATASQAVEFKKGDGLKLNFVKLDSNDFKKIVANSTITGQYDKAAINKKLSDFDKTSIFDTTKKTGTVNIAPMISKFGEKDSVVLTVKKDEKDKGTGITIKPSNVVENDPTHNGTGDATKPLPESIEIVPYSLLAEYRDRHYPQLYRTDVGFKVPGDHYTVHIFLDEFGRPLFGSIPSGIQNKYHYMIHVLSSKANEKNVVYNFTNVSGTLSDASVIVSGDVKINAQQGAVVEDNGKQLPAVTEIAHNLFPTSDELKFDLEAIVIDNKNQKIPMKLTSYSIKKTSFYSSAFNIAGVYSWASNPAFQLVNSPVNQGKQTVKTTDKTTGLMAALLYTVYWSPFNAWFKTKEGIKLSPWGRTYLDDSTTSLFRKIYPAIGFGLKDQVFTNILAGFNFQPVKDLGIFIGTNIRKKNTFDMPGFVEGQTDVSQDQFNFYQNKEWKAGWALGVVIDVSVFTKILGNISTEK
jgi:hypothetical protein